MADGFDPCECVWNHEHAMQRLINLVSAYCRFFFYPFFSCPSVQALNDPWTVHPFSEIEPGSNSSIYIHVALAFIFIVVSKWANSTGLPTTIIEILLECYHFTCTSVSSKARLYIL